MFFRSPFENVRDARPPRVLALYSDSSIGDIRIKPFLNALLARGVIGEYQIADRAMNVVGPLKSFQFTHIWCQRNVSTAQFRFLRRHAQAPIVYDVDDLITSVPAFVMKTRPRTQRKIAWCLQHARAVTVASGRLGASLRADVPLLPRDPVVLKNGCASATAPNARAPRKQVIWTSGDFPLFSDRHPQFIEALAKIVNGAGYEAILVGRFDERHTAMFERSRHIAYLDFASYREFLRANAGAIGLAPLPSDLPPAAQRYFDCKSDIKLMDYLSCGLVPVCSSAVPYATSSLFLPRLAGGDPHALLERLQACIADHARMVEYVDESVHAPGLLRPREFSELSKTLDHVFA